MTLRWRHVIVFAGLSWLFFGFLGYLRFVVGSNAPAFYIQQFLVKKAALPATLHTSLEALAYGLGMWTILACFAPRVAILALPWIWGPCSGEWSIDSLSTADWHHVRYVLPMTALVLAAGLIGYARAGTWILKRRSGVMWAALAWAILCASGAAGTYAMKSRMDRIPIPIAAGEAAELWRSIEQVGPDDGVLADHLVSASLSSRRRLYGYLVNWNLPMRYPELDPGIRWLFVRNDYPLLKVLLDQGFEVVHEGPKLTVARQIRNVPKTENPIFWNFARTQNGDRMSILGTTRWRVLRLGAEHPRTDGNRPPGIPGRLAWVLEDRARCPVASMSREPERSP